MLKTTLNKAQHNLIGGGGDFTLNSKPPKSNSKIPILNLPKYIKFSALCATLLFAPAQADFNKYCSNGICTIDANETSNDTITIPKATTINTFDNFGKIEVGNDYGIYNNSEITTFINRGIIQADVIAFFNWGTITTFINDNKILAGYGFAINNMGTIQEITNTNTGIIQGMLSNSGFIKTLNNSGEMIRGKLGIENRKIIENVINSGNIEEIYQKGIITNLFNSGKSSKLINLENYGTVVRLVNQGEINVILNWNEISNITNSGTITEFNNWAGKIINNISNFGTISNLINRGTITHTLTNSGTISHLNNIGTLASGIVNESGGTMTLNSTGNIGLNTNNNLHISNANSVEKAITIENISLHTDKLKVDAGVKGGIFIKQITAEVERDGLTLEDLIDEQGVSFGSDCQNENCIIGLDENGNESEFSVFVRNSSVILNDFYAKRGQKTEITLDTSALSGSTFSQTLIANSRLRDIRIDTILKEFNIKNFQTNFENSKESNLESLESYNLGKVRKYASLTQDMILSENAEFTAQAWSDEDLIKELDDIFIANKHGGEYYTFIVPYFSYDSSDIGGGDIKGNTRGFLAGIQTPLTNDAGIVGGFFGYERADRGLSSPSFNGSLDINETSFLVGASYYNVFNRKGLVEYYLSGNAKLDRSQSKINRGYEGGETKAKPKSIGYGIESKVGANIYNIYDNSVLSPEIGLAYQGISMENYTLNYGSVKEHYYSEDTNFVDVITALRWQRAANPTVKYNVSLGAYWNLYEDGKVRGIAAGIPLNEKVRTSDYFAFTNVGITYAILENTELSFNYNGILGDKTQSHTGYVRLGIWW